MKTSAKQWIGYFIMLVVTGIAFYLVMSHRMISLGAAITLFVFAAVQVALQLFLFMEVRKGKSGVKWISLGGGLLVALLAIYFLMLLE